MKTSFRRASTGEAGSARALGKRASTGEARASTGEARASTGEARAAAIVLLDMPEGALKAEGTLSGQEGREGVVTPGRLEGCKTGDVSRG